MNGSLLELGKSPVKMEKMEKLFSLLPEINEEHILKIAEKNEYVESRKFFEWLYEYAKNLKKMINKTKALCDINIEEFEDLVGYCLENVILHKKGVRAAADEKKDYPIYTADNISILCNIMDKYFEYIFYNDISKSTIDKKIRQNTGLSEEKCDILWNYYLKEEQALWRKYSMKLQINIDRRLNDLLDAVLSIEEE